MAKLKTSRDTPMCDDNDIAGAENLNWIIVRPRSMKIMMGVSLQQNNSKITMPIGGAHTVQHIHLQD